MAVYTFIIGILIGGAVALPSDINKLSSNASSHLDFFWHVDDNGAPVQAFLSGGPAPATLEEAENDIEFWLYRNGRNPGVQIHPDCDNCLGSYLSGAPLIILSHGFSSNHEGSFGDTHRNALTTRPEQLNVVFVNWEKLAGAPWYDTAAANCNPVGTHTAKLINFLVGKGVTSLDKIHFIGHSLGSHVGNFVAKHVTGAPESKIGRISGLDPALPLFGSKDDSQRIDPSDAVFVDVMHTAMGVIPDGLAFTEPRGHVDFYPNSGKDQPGCGIDAFGSCSHGRANAFFAESVANPDAFVACKCNSWAEYDSGRCLCLDQAMMGWSTPSSARGLYYLRTKANPPFGQG